MLFYLFILFLHSVKIQAEDSIEEKIYKKIKSSYPNTRPSRNSYIPLVVSLTNDINHIADFNEKQEKLTCTARFTAFWIDEYFKWDLSEFPLHVIHVKAQDIWLPDLTITTAVDETKQRDGWDKRSVKIFNNGMVIWTFGGKLELYCGVYLSYYPFDSQQCSIAISSMTHSNTTLILTNLTQEVGLKYYTPSSQWDLTWTKIYILNIPTSREESLSVFMSTFCLKRKNLYHIINLILPSIAISFLAALGFLIPCDAGEKISYQITVILSFTVFQLKVADSVPENGVSTPIISTYLTATMIISSISVLFSVISLRISGYNGKFPNILKFIIKFRSSKLSNINKTIEENKENNWKIFSRKLDYLLFIIFCLIFSILVIYIFQFSKKSSNECKKLVWDGIFEKFQ